MNKTPNPDLVEDAIALSAARDAICEVLDLIEDEDLRILVIDACAGYCAAFIIGATHSIHHAAQQIVGEATSVSMN